MDNISKAPAPIKKANCSTCGGTRNCDILGHHQEHGGDEYYSWNKSWYILRCRGCDHVFVQTVATNSEDFDYGYDESGGTDSWPIETTDYWPSLAKREMPDWMVTHDMKADTDGALHAALIELYKALNNDICMLAAIGIRTAFDIAAELLGADAELTFKAKLEHLVKAGHIGKIDHGRLETLVDAGSASAHRGWRPSVDDLNTMMDVLEQFVHDAFIVPTKNQHLDAKLVKVKSKVPPRKSSKAKT